MPDSRYIAKVRRRKTFWNNVTRVVIQLFVWTGAAVLYYFAFSIFFDTPVEYRLKHSTDRLRREYATLTGRYDSLNRVMENVIARDRNVFHILFEADPYDFEEENAANRWNFYEGLLSQSTIELQKQFARRLDATERAVADLADSYDRMAAAIDSCAYRNRIPAIQPIINKQLTLLTTSYGMRINPFQKVLRSHQGVDYAIPEGSRVFATADGTVKEVSLRNSTSGQTVVIDHGGGYETLYSHLGRIGVRRGQRVWRGDIIALSQLRTVVGSASALRGTLQRNARRSDPLLFHGTLTRRLPADDAHRSFRYAVIRLTFEIMSRIRLILLDFDGTLVDTRRANARAYVETLREVGYAMTEEEYAARHFGVRCPEFLRSIGIDDPAEIDRLRRRKIELYPRYFDLVTLNRPLWEFCQQFRAQGGRVWIVSTGQRANIDNVMRHLHLEAGVDGIISALDAPQSKPDPGCFLKAMEIEGATPDETLIFEDSAVGIEAARRSGAAYFVVKL